MKEPKSALSPDLGKLIAEIDEFKGRWQVLDNLSPERLSALRKVATVEGVGTHGPGYGDGRRYFYNRNQLRNDACILEPLMPHR
jgi:hypothetical protein